MLLPLLDRHHRHVPTLNRSAEIAWALYRADPTANAAALDEAAEHCLRSLAVNAAQPKVRALLKQVSEARE